MASPFSGRTGPVDVITDSCYMMLADHSSGANPWVVVMGRAGCSSSPPTRLKAVEVTRVELVGARV